MKVEEAILTRRSTRKFKDQKIEKEKLDRIIEAGRYAPSGGNSQTNHFFVITDKALLDKLAETVQKVFKGMEVKEGMYRSIISSINKAQAGNYVFHYDPACLIVIANKKDYGNNIADTACALENMMIMANELDLGACWINQLKWLNEDEELRNIFAGYGLRDDERIYGALALGYPDSEDGLPERKPLPRKGNEVTYID